MKHLNLLAFDLGAESGRAILGKFDGEHLTIHEIHRFPNEPVELPSGLHWDILHIFRELKHGLAFAAQREGHVDSIGIDTWGVDFGLLDDRGELLGAPYHYRDSRTSGILQKAFSIVPKEEIFAYTGIQFMQFNTLFQLLAMRLQNKRMLDTAHRLLFIPDILNFFFTGLTVNEYTIASTSQMLDVKGGGWAGDLLAKMGIPTHILGDIIPPGAKIGTIRDPIAQETSAMGVSVALPGCHDTASAVVAVPATPAKHEDGMATGNYAYISSGTWSLMGVETKKPYLGEHVAQFNFTNEGGVGGTFRFLKNIMGLWLIQRCRKEWQKEGEALSYDALTHLAGQAKPLVSFVDPDDDSFLNPPSMPAAIQDFCKRTGQLVPETRGAILRCALESLALRYRMTLEQLEIITGRHIDTIYIVGGGSKNHLLNQYTADATGRIVIAGPAEATAIGNLLVQAMALGEVKDMTEIRQIIRASFQLEEFEPREEARGAWEEAYARFKILIERG
ncbi:MAG TPA: rhamnulokinase [Firmicutes bacterium]|nr:rhamnulokinase [Bacillota bacterium]HHY97531.1 rhamnulokinase [Bacillota bacterium]